MLQSRVGKIALINVDRIPSDRVGFGSRLHVVENTGEEMVYQLVMPEDADAAKGLISTTSPIGRAFLNKEVGDTIKVTTPGRRAPVRDREALHHPRRRAGMNGPVSPPPTADFSSRSLVEPYSPQLRTALILTGTGTAGAYHAGVLRALHEAGVKIDIVGGNGVGVVGALFAAVDGAQRLWDEKGFWRSPSVRSLYPWRRMLRVAAGAMATGDRDCRRPDRRDRARPGGVPDRFRRAKMARASAARRPSGASTGCRRLAADWSARTCDSRRRRSRPRRFPPGCRDSPCWCSAWSGSSRSRRAGWGRIRRRVRGPFWWRAIRAPLSSAEATAHTWHAMWDLVRGAARAQAAAAGRTGPALHGVGRREHRPARISGVGAGRARSRRPPRPDVRAGGGAQAPRAGAPHDDRRRRKSAGPRSSISPASRATISPTSSAARLPFPLSATRGR